MEEEEALRRAQWHRGWEVAWAWGSVEGSRGAPTPLSPGEGRWEAVATMARLWAEPAAGNGDSGVTWGCWRDVTTVAAPTLASAGVFGEAVWLGHQMCPCQAVLWRGASAPWPRGSHRAWPVHRPRDAPMWSTAWSTIALTVPLARGTATPPAQCREPRFTRLPVGIGCSGSAVTCISPGKQPLLYPTILLR